MKPHVKILALCVCLALPATFLPAQNGFVELNLRSQSQASALLSSSAPPTFLNALLTIERAAGDDQIAGIVLNISNLTAGHGTMWELRTALEEFRATGKSVIAFIGDAGINHYYLASVADKIIIHERGMLTLLGYSWGRGFMKNGLEMLGIGMRELRFFEHKSAYETYTRDSLSDADIAQYGAWLDDVMAVTRDAITSSRGLSTEEFYAIINNEFMFSANGSLARGLVDGIGGRQAIVGAARELLGGRSPEFFVFGDQESSVTSAARSYGPPRAPRGFWNRPPVIAVINANGATDMDTGISARALAKNIEELSRRDRVSAIIIRITSPGGGLEASELIADAIQSARRRMPVIVTMGSVAGSGGYWASVTASHIMATPATMTGSIGVISGWIYDNGLSESLGLTFDVIKLGNSSDMYSGFLLGRDLTELEVERFRLVILELYDYFVARVARERGLTINEVHAVAQGRIHSGGAALEAGLIDSIGGLSHAIRVARELAGIPEGQEVIFEQYPRPTFFDNLVDRLMRFRIFAWLAILFHNASANPALVAIEAFLPAHVAQDIRFRLARNGSAMPIMPFDAWAELGAAETLR
ncbi:MAG: signal peptide peptidase SppA [Treponema sp.]|nr:signal peptide peptidase SppA [Treponema sp.]